MRKAKGPGKPRVLHVLSQRPLLTGSGITLDALVRRAAAAGWEQGVVVGVPHDDTPASVGGLPPDRIFPLRFESGALPYPVPGMSDVMPYPSTRFGAMNAAMLAAYRRAWRGHLAAVLDDFAPDVIHSHHIWLLSALLRDLAPGTPIVTQCHATGFRQLELCPHLADEVTRGCGRNDGFIVLHEGHATQLAGTLGVDPARIHVVGAGYRDEFFSIRGREPDVGPTVLYVGKYSHAKGLPWLLDAVERLAATVPGLSLHVAGDGAGAEAETLRMRMAAMGCVRMHGQVGQGELADLMRRAAVCVLPSFYEGLPLVLVEAFACGCRIVATDLPGVTRVLAPHLGQWLTTVPLPRLTNVDVPHADDLPRFVDELHAALAEALRRGPVDFSDPAQCLALLPFTWHAVYKRVEAVWRDVGGLLESC